MARRKIAIDILTPDQGIETRLSPSMIPKRNVPRIDDGNAFYGVVQKDYGTSLFIDATASTPGAAPINGFFTAEFPNETRFQAFNATGMYRYVSSASGFVNDGQVYTGTETDYWDACMHNDEMYYTNGVDMIQHKPSYAVTGTNLASVATSTYKANAIVSFANHLNIYHTVESGTENYKRARWTDVGILGNTSTDWTGGTAGFVDVQDGDGQILTAGLLGGGSVVVYFTGSIHIQEWVGGSTVYKITKMVTGLDIPSRRCFAANDSIHYFFTRENIYEYGGGRSVKPIGDPIKKLYQSDINPDSMDKAWIEFIKEDNEVRVHVPTGNSSTVNKEYICKVSGNKYTWFSTSREYTAHGKHIRESGLTIGELQGNIGAQTWQFGDMFAKSQAPVHILGDASGNVVKRDKAVYSICVSGTSTAQNFAFYTKDISPSEDIDPEYSGSGKYYDRSEYATQKNRWLTIRCEAKGEGSLTAHYSIDGSDSFTQCDEGAKSLTDTWEPYTWDVDITSELFAAQFSNSGEDEIAQIRHVKLEYVPGSEV